MLNNEHSESCNDNETPRIPSIECPVGILDDRERINYLINGIFIDDPSKLSPNPFFNDITKICTRFLPNSYESLLKHLDTNHKIRLFVSALLYYLAMIEGFNTFKLKLSVPDDRYAFTELAHHLANKIKEEYIKESYGRSRIFVQYLINTFLERE